MPRIVLEGKPNPKQKAFFSAHSRFVAYGGARGGGKSWALRRKLVTLCLRYGGIRCLLVRRTYPELKGNHLYTFLEEYKGLISYNDSDKTLSFPNSSKIVLGYCDSERDTLRYQGQEYDIIAIDEATQLTEYQFSIFKACLRGTRPFPRRMYLTCNPGGVGHAWVKRLFIDKLYREGEDAKDYTFIPARVYDNPILEKADPDYVRSLETLPEKLKKAWLFGEWDVFEGQFFPEFSEGVHTADTIPNDLTYFAAADYGFDMFALLVLGVDRGGKVYVVDEFCRENLTLGEAGRHAEGLLSRYPVKYAVISPDMYNRRQDSGRSGVEIFSEGRKLPPLSPADNRRIAGWRVVREYLAQKEDGTSGLVISKKCKNLIRSLPLLLCDKERQEDASDHPHEFTHSPEALRYGLMSRVGYREEKRQHFFKRKSIWG